MRISRPIRHLKETKMIRIAQITTVRGHINRDIEILTLPCDMNNIRGFL